MNGRKNIIVLRKTIRLEVEKSHMKVIIWGALHLVLKTGIKSIDQKSS